MQDYQPLDLSKLCNVGTSFADPQMAKLLGKQTFHGLPFRIGANAKRCFIGFNGKGASRKPVTVRIGKKARHILVAHTLLQSKLMEGENVGHVIANYVFRFADGVEIRIPIRERMEIHIVPTAWGQWPFLARPDQKNLMHERYEGEWGFSGYRQTEAGQGTAQAYYLWAWTNPRPDQAIVSLSIQPCDRKFIVAGITLGHLDENPFVRTTKRDVKITLPHLADAKQPFKIDVEVDRGVSNYAHPLPQQPVDKFLADDRKGFGEALNEKASPAYVEIAATPSATVTVKSHGKKLGQTNWGELEKRGKVRTPRVQLEIVDRGRNWVHVTVVDDATNRPVPCRVHFRSPEGIPYQPHGHHNNLQSNMPTWHKDIGGDLRLGQISYAYIDGKCQGWLPRGEVIVDVARGFEYEPLRSRVRIERDQRELTLRIKRWTNMNEQRWFSGDTHVHFLGTQGAHREAQGEDLNVVNLLQSQWGHLFTNTEDWIGKPTATNDGKTIVYCTQENRQHILGHLTLLGLKQPVMPWCSDGPSEAEIGGGLDETLSHWADKCHAQGGTVVIPHLPNPNGETSTLIATGRADAVEMIDFSHYKHNEYYRYLNCGYKLPLVGGTDKMSAEVPVGLYRTYAYMPDDEFTYDHWLKAVRAGRTFISGGPIINLTANGAQVGDTIKLDGNGGTVEVEACAESIFPIHTLELVKDGKVVASTVERKGSSKLTLKASVKVDKHSWLATRCGGPKYDRTPHHDVWDRGMFAHTSPIYLAVGGDWWMFNKNTAEYMLTLIEGGLTYIRDVAPHHPRDLVTHHHSDHDHMKYLEGPFNEAAEALHKRMHQLGVPH